MLLKLRTKTRLAGAMALAFTMAATGVSAGTAVQSPGYGAVSVVGGSGFGMAELLQVHHKNGWRGNNWCRHNPRRCRGLSNRGHRADRFLHGHRGSKFRRHGYRRHHDGWWYPFAAFAITGYLLEQQQQHRHSGWQHIPSRNMGKHDAWCDWRYKTYSHRSKTFQPYHGPRKFCNSPYDLL